LLLLALVGLVLVVRANSLAPRLAPVGAIGGTSAPAGSPKAIVGRLAAKGAESTDGARRPLAITAHLRIFSGPGSYSDDRIAEIAEPIEQALSYVSNRTGMQLSRPVNIVFDRRPDTCALDAVAYTHVRTASVFACADTPRRRAINILAHELVHQLAHDHFGPAHLQADLILSEGLATWGAGDYWLSGEPDFRSFVAHHYGGTLLPMTTNPHQGTTIDQLNQLYYQWAAFVEWIDTTYGRDRLYELYRNSSGREPGSAAYEAILGISIGDAETRWRDWIGGQAHVGG
jgi:hypothetical protein